MNHPTTIEHFTFKGKAQGPRLVIMGGIHGNERCGPEALRRLLPRLQEGKIILQAGQLTLVPVANPGAYAENKRFLERNLNRRLFPKPAAEQKNYEDKLDIPVCAVLEQADYLLDIHSYTVGGPPFILLGGLDAEEKKFAEALNVTRCFVWNWKGAFTDSNLPETDSWGTTDYARSKGARAVTLECGQHLDPRNADVAYAAAVNALRYLGLIDDATLEREIKDLDIPALGPRQFARMRTVIKNEALKLPRPFRHFEPVRKGDALAVRPDGSAIPAATDGFIILPNATAPVGAEMVYLAVDEEPFPESPSKKKNA